MPSATPTILSGQALIHHVAHHNLHSFPSPDITITVWTDPNCNLKNAGDRVDLDTGQRCPTSAVGENYVIGTVSQSYWLGRDLINNERLDWSTCNESTGPCNNMGDIKADCTTFLLTTSPDSNDNALNKHTCYLLDPGALVSHLSREEYFVRYVLIFMHLVRESLGWDIAPTILEAVCRQHDLR